MTTTAENRITMSAEAYNGLQKKMDHAMAKVYADRLGEIAGAVPHKSYANSIVAARINNTKMFSFFQSFIPYLIVRDKFHMSRYGSDHSVILATACASVHADQRRSRECVWDGDKEFGIDTKHTLLFGELTVEAASKVANGLVDYVRDYVLVSNHLASLPHKGTVPPFMTATAGHVLIHDGLTGQPLKDDWTGICVDSRDTKKHWYIGLSRGERSFSALAAKDMRAAILESQLLINSEAEELAEAQSS
jgi:hypothetical protein